MFFQFCITETEAKHLTPAQKKKSFKSSRASNVQMLVILCNYENTLLSDSKIWFPFMYFSPISPYFQPWDDAQSDATPLWHALLLSSKSKKLQTVSVMHPGYCADKNRPAADGIIYVLVNVLGRLTALTLYRGTHGMSNFLLQTPISFSVTLRQTSRSSLTRCGSLIFQYVCDKKIGHWRGFRAIFGKKKLGESEHIYWMSSRNVLSWSKTHKYT